MLLLSYCVVNTNGREHLLACLGAIERTHPGDVEHEILVLDNASDDGSAEAPTRHREDDLHATPRGGSGRVTTSTSWAR